MHNAKNSDLFSNLNSPQSMQKKEVAEKQMHKTTPMMEQYIEIKAAYPDVLLFYQMGDFYELFFQDAIQAANSLKITLTKRGKYLGEDIPMCGVPVHACHDYLQKLISLGYRVALCEQAESPMEAKKRGYKSVVKRRVVRLVTPSTLTEAQLLDPQQSNYFVTLGYDEKTQSYAISWVDISTGIFGVAPSSFDHLLTDLMRYEPKEIIISDAFSQNPAYANLLKILGRLVIFEPQSYFDAKAAVNRILSFYNVFSLDSFSPFTNAELSAISSALAYVQKTQLDQHPPLMKPVSVTENDFVFMDNATKNNLELLCSLSGKKKGSLLSAIDRTTTGSGARLLRERLITPLKNSYKINERLESVMFFYQEPQIQNDLLALLQRSSDMPRALSRLALIRGSPHDLQNLANGLEILIKIHKIFKNSLLPRELSDANEILKKTPISLMQTLKSALADELPNSKKDGDFIRPLYNKALDEARQLRDESRIIIANMQQDYILETGIKNLKIKYNNVLGYFIEITAMNADKLLKDPKYNTKFIHRQSMTNAVRFTTKELNDMQIKISQAAERALEIELNIFDDLSRQLIEFSDFIQKATLSLSIFDVSNALATLAREQNYKKPIVDDSLTFIIEKGRHPVVEQALHEKSEKPFIANDCNLSPIKSSENSEKKGTLWLLTGPNMGGKSTFLRQNALMTIMAQMGSFVPAEFAHIGVIDKLFSRVGASDDLAQGRSTFMVEMIETATILNQSTPKSLVILDEIGRGTATFDGLAIAFSCIEHLHEKNTCRTIFATHFHELTKLEKKLPRLQNVTMQVKEWNQEVVFLHSIKKGVADRSYGIQVAKLAGLPEKVIQRAYKVLEQLESKSQKNKEKIILEEISNEIPEKSSSLSIKQTALYQKIQAIKPDELSPKDALSVLYSLKNELHNL